MRRVFLFLMMGFLLTACNKEERHEVVFTDISNLRQCADAPATITVINSEAELQPYLANNRYQMCNGNNPFPLPIDFQTETLIALDYYRPSCTTFDRTFYEYPESQKIVLEIDETKDKGCTSTLFSGGAYFDFWMTIPKIKEGYTMHFIEK